MAKDQSDSCTFLYLMITGIKMEMVSLETDDVEFETYFVCSPIFETLLLTFPTQITLSKKNIKQNTKKFRFRKTNQY